MSRWMVVYGNMRWEDVSFEENGGNISIKVLKSGVCLEGKVKRCNDYTNDYEVLLEDSRLVNIIDMQLVDDHFERNKVIFKNRVGLHKEIRRYIDFSLN